MQNIKSKEKKIAAKEIEKAEKSEAKKKSRIKWFFSRENIIGRRVVSALICIITVALWEFGVHLFVYQKILVENLFLLAFSVPVGIVVSILFSLFPKKVNKVTAQIGILLLYIYFAAQYIYYCVFGSFFSMFQIRMGGEAVTGFWKETVGCIKENIAYILLLIIPIVIFELCIKFKLIYLEKLKLKGVGIGTASVLVTHGLCIFALWVSGTSAYSFYDVYFSDTTTTDRSVEVLGVMTTSRLELWHMAFGDIDNNLGIAEEEIPKIEAEPEKKPEPAPEEPEQTPEPQPVVYGKNVIEDIDFEKLDAATNQSAIKTLNDYFGSHEGTSKNEYTGMLKDYNLIVLTCESFSPYVIREDLTPTLYKLSHEGFVFNNFYNCYPNNTTNGEYTVCMGNFPDLTRSKSNGSFSNSKDNYLPYCLGNIFKAQKNIDCYAYHNYKGTYYNRENSHPNMGYNFITAGDGMTFTTNWPASDYEMMTQSVDDYINKDQFHAYYMTFSGHYRYDFSINPMSARNRSKVDKLNYSEPVKAYLACNYELEKAMEYLLRRLNEAGVADKTAIVMTNDHFPYGLKDKEYSELAGRDIDTDFEKYKSSLIFWVGGLEEPVIVDEYCSTVDILPTILNLFGFEYDSRILNGTDVFAPDAEHLAILSNGSFLNKYVKFNSKTGEATFTEDAPAEIPDGYVGGLNQLVKNKMSASAAILNYDYYNFVYTNSGLKPAEEQEVSSQPEAQ